MEMSCLSVRSRMAAVNLTVLYLQLISNKAFGKIHDTNSDELRSATNRIQYGFSSDASKTF